MYRVYIFYLYYVNLFSQHKVNNIIPFDGEADYHGLVFSKDESEQYLKILFEEIPGKTTKLLFLVNIISQKEKWLGLVTKPIITSILE